MINAIAIVTMIAMEVSNMSSRLYVLGTQNFNARFDSGNREDLKSMLS